MLSPTGLLTLGRAICKTPVIAATNSLATQQAELLSAEDQSKKERNNTPDLREFLNSWPYDPDNNVRLAPGADGREIIVVRRAMGLETYEVDGRPDGSKPHWMGSLLEFHLQRLAVAQRAGSAAIFKLSPVDCSELFEEGLIYWHRSMSFFRLKDWTRAERDTARVLAVINFVKQYAEQEEGGVRPADWRPMGVPLNEWAVAAFLGNQARCEEIANEPYNGAANISETPEHLNDRRAVLGALLQKLEESFAIRPVLAKHEKSVFRREGDYLAIRYGAHATTLKTTRGLDFLGYLLRHPGREIHVSELVSEGRGLPAPTIRVTRRPAGSRVASRLSLAAPILDSKAKAEYKRRLHELREDIDEAERCNDPDRAASARGEMDAIGRQLAVAVGLGGRDRRASSDAERARSAITKRIKDAIKRIAKTIPSLGRHLSARVKTGYYCSYNPHPDRPVPWEF